MNDERSVDRIAVRTSYSYIFLVDKFSSLDTVYSHLNAASERCAEILKFIRYLHQTEA